MSYIKKKEQLDIDSIFTDFVEDLTGRHQEETGDYTSILDFIENEINLGEGFKLTKCQLLVLKIAYGEELDEEDLDILEQWQAESKTTWNDQKIKNVQVLAVECGRRSGKSSLAAIIAVYEFFCLSRLSNPQEHYGVASSTPIGILVLATTAEQAKKFIFRQIIMLIKNSKYFSNLINKGKIFVGKEEIAYEEKGIYIQSGNSRSSSQVGGTLKCMIMDEVARFQSVDGESNAMSLWSNLGISCAPFKEHAKRIAISSAWEEGDAMEQLYTTTDNSPYSVGFRLKSWDLNLHISRDNPVVAYEYSFNPTQAALEYEGIRPITQDAFLDAKFITRATRGRSVITASSISSNGLITLHVHKCARRAERDTAVHIDPGVKKDAYALAFGHAEPDERGGFKYIIDGILCWEPTYEAEVSMSDVGEKIRLINKHRPISSVTADHYNSVETIQRLKQDGISAEVVFFSNKQQLTMYMALRSLLAEDRVILPKDNVWTPVAVRELQRVQLINGVKIDHKQGESKDVADSIAAVVYKLSQKTHQVTAPERKEVYGLTNNNPIYNYDNPTSQFANREKAMTKLKYRRAWSKQQLRNL